MVSITDMVYDVIAVVVGDGAVVANRVEVAAAASNGLDAFLGQRQCGISIIKLTRPLVNPSRAFDEVAGNIGNDVNCCGCAAAWRTRIYP